MTVTSNAKEDESADGRRQILEQSFSQTVRQRSGEHVDTSRWPVGAFASLPWLLWLFDAPRYVLRIAGTSRGGDITHADRKVQAALDSCAGPSSILEEHVSGRAWKSYTNR